MVEQSPLGYDIILGDMEVEGREAEAEAEHTCDTCGLVFAKRNALFKHLRSHGIFPANEVSYVRVGLLVGWISRSPDGDAHEWIKDGSLTYGTTDGMQDEVEIALWEAIKVVEGIGLEDEQAARPKGLSRASACALRGLEDSTHGIADVFSMQLKDVHTRAFDRAWVDSVNEKLPKFMRVHEVYVMPKIGDFHAENTCSQRVYEYMFPMSALMIESGATTAATESMLFFLRQHGLDMSPHEISFVGDSFFAANDAKVEGQERGLRNGEWDTKRPRNKMDEIFISKDNEETSAQKRIILFRNMKVLFKKYGGNQKQAYHNFAAGGACPDDAVTMRRVDRVYHKEVVELEGSTKDYTEVEVGVKRVHTDMIPIRAEGDYTNLWAVFSLSGNSFLRGQIRHMLAMAICVLNKWLPIELFSAALSTDNVLNLPSLPGYPLMLSECKYDRWEAKYYMRLDPRRIDGADTTRIDSWKQIVRSSIARNYISAAGGNSNALSNIFLQNLQNKCRKLCLSYFSMRTLKNRVNLEQRLLELKKSKCAGVPAAYVEVLRLLRAADQSGLWPTSSIARSKYIANIPSTVDKSGKKIERKAKLPMRERLIDESLPAGTGAEASLSVSEEKSDIEEVIGGSFSIGCYPKPLLEPKGNSLFPELLVACFKLERLIAPHRPPSSTIAVNRHAQFKPHRDSGAGNGQCQSLIVGLGDYYGGETVAENVAYDIRYNPVEFNGWSERHWTLPFVGERYSLVWFTPCGVEESDMFWLRDPNFLSK